ncbi:hypothetical protein CVT25_001656 [Psilocybe cyanescens]|uniref:Uncharacterized protein n=1 Tax=Psilocybe cyanescens TaxID=93625 RepID=A0A409WQ65_PSICY|nr:hypothetical protein CVT25_001656 [Psilocybe cyanescens]
MTSQALGIKLFDDACEMEAFSEEEVKVGNVDGEHANPLLNGGEGKGEYESGPLFILISGSPSSSTLGAVCCPSFSPVESVLYLLPCVQNVDVLLDACVREDA